MGGVCGGEGANPRPSAGAQCRTALPPWRPPTPQAWEANTTSPNNPLGLRGAREAVMPLEVRPHQGFGRFWEGCPLLEPV